MTAFMQEHSGFKLKEIIHQQNERIMMEVVSNSGGLFWNCAKQRYVEVHNFDVKEVLQHPFILGATPETAREHSRGRRPSSNTPRLVCFRNRPSRGCSPPPSED